MIRIPRSHLRPVGRFTEYDLAVRGQEYRGLDRFIEISVELTGFSHAELTATALIKAHFEEVRSILGVAKEGEPPLAFDDFINAKLSAAQLLASPLYGPVARNLIRLWYLGHWQQLSVDWVAGLPKHQKDKFDPFHHNINRVVSSEAYKEGLAWPAIGTNPVGAKQPGFGTWAWPPR